MKLLIANKLDKSGLDLLKNHPGIKVEIRENISEEELLQIIPEYEGLIVRSKPRVPKKVMQAGTNLRVIGRAGVGLDNIDLETAKKQEVEVVNCPDANTTAAAEHTIALMLAACRNIPAAHESLKNGRWDRKKLMGIELHKKTLGLIGCGRIATHVAKIAKGFGMDIIGYDPFVDEKTCKTRHIQKIDTLNELLKTADFVSLHLAKTPETTNLLGEAELALMKPSAILINCARGGLVNEPALLTALRTNQIAGATLDVWETEPDTKNPLQKLKNVIATPHLGASTKEAQQRVSQDIIQKVIEKLAVTPQTE